MSSATGPSGPERDRPVTVAIPVLNGGRLLGEVLAAVRAQRLERPIELIVADSGSTDGSARLARADGATVIAIPPGHFSHGGTRNLLMERAAGDHVAFLTQDAVPVGEHWLASLLEGFALAEGVGLVYGPYIPRPGAGHVVRADIQTFFGSLAPGRRPRVDRTEGAPAPLPGRESFFTDANGCVARWAWERVPFREVSYAEDRLLGQEMLAAGIAKVFQPSAAVVHSHDYPPLAHLRRCFDEWRGLLEVYGWREPSSLRRNLLVVRGQLRADWDLLTSEDTPPARMATSMAISLRHHLLRMVGSQLGSHADRLPPRLRRALSLERRAGFSPHRRPGAESPTANVIRRHD